MGVRMPDQKRSNKMNTNYSNTPFDDGGELRLWDYIDGIASAEERTLIEKLLERNAAWRARYRELLDVHQLMNASELEEPSLRFTKNVMDEIARVHIAPAATTYINKHIIRGIAFFFITVIVGFLIYGFAQVDWSAKGDSSLPIVDLGKVDYGRFFNNTYVNVFMMINVILGLFLLDRYLDNKRKKHHKEA
jgi:hypothetical protein